MLREEMGEEAEGKSTKTGPNFGKGNVRETTSNEAAANAELPRVNISGIIHTAGRVPNRRGNRKAE